MAGNTLGDLHGRWLADAIALRPSVISLLAGINDAACEVNGAPDYTADAFERGYRSLLERSQSELPGVRFVLCEPFALPCGLVNERWIAPLHQRQKIVMSLAREFDAVFVPLQREFDAASQRGPPSYWLYDGIHPTAQSHQMIAARGWRR